MEKGRREGQHALRSNRGRTDGGTYVGEVDDGLSACPAEDVQECEREGVDRAVLAVVRQPLLAVCSILAPVSTLTGQSPGT